MPRLFSSLQLDFPEAVQVQLGEISTLQRLFHVHHPGVSDTDEGKLVHSGDFVKLSSDYFEVSCYCVNKTSVIQIVSSNCMRFSDCWSVFLISKCFMEKALLHI